MTEHDVRPGQLWVWFGSAHTVDEQRTLRDAIMVLSVDADERSVHVYDVMCSTHHMVHLKTLKLFWAQLK